MTRRKRGSSIAGKAPAGAESAAKTPLEALKASEPTAPSSSPADMSEDDDRPGVLPPLCTHAAVVGPEGTPWPQECMAANALQISQPQPLSMLT